MSPYKMDAVGYDLSHEVDSELVDYNLGPFVYTFIGETSTKEGAQKIVEDFKAEQIENGLILFARIKHFKDPSETVDVKALIYDPDNKYKKGKTKRLGPFVVTEIGKTIRSEVGDFIKLSRSVAGKEGYKIILARSQDINTHIKY
jgi:hypothetical protein